MGIDEKIGRSAFIALSTVTSAAGIVVANDIIEKKVEKSIEPWKRACLKTAVFTCVSAAAIKASASVAGFFAADIPIFVGIILGKNK